MGIFFDDSLQQQSRSPAASALLLLVAVAAVQPWAVSRELLGPYYIIFVSPFSISIFPFFWRMECFLDFRILSSPFLHFHFPAVIRMISATLKCAWFRERSEVNLLASVDYDHDILFKTWGTPSLPQRPSVMRSSTPSNPRSFSTWFLKKYPSKKTLRFEIFKSRMITVVVNYLIEEPLLGKEIERMRLPKCLLFLTFNFKECLDWTELHFIICSILYKKISPLNQVFTIAFIILKRKSLRKRGSLEVEMLNYSGPALSTTAASSWTSRSAGVMLLTSIFLRSCRKFTTSELNSDGEERGWPFDKVGVWEFSALMALGTDGVSMIWILEPHSILEKWNGEKEEWNLVSAGSVISRLKKEKWKWKMEKWTLSNTGLRRPPSAADCHCILYRSPVQRPFL